MKVKIASLKKKILASITLMLMFFNFISPTVYGFITDMNGNSRFGVISRKSFNLWS